MSNPSLRVVPRRRHRQCLRFVILLIVALPACRVYAQSAVHPRPAPTAVAVRRGGPIKVDGLLDEVAWASARPVGGFRQTFPLEGAAATQTTEVRFLYDDEAIYIGARMYDTLGRVGVRGALARRDQLLLEGGAAAPTVTSDAFAVVLD